MPDRSFSRLIEYLNKNLDPLQRAYDVAERTLEEYDYCFSLFSNEKLNYLKNKEQQIQNQLKGIQDIRDIPAPKIQESHSIHDEIMDQYRYLNRLEELEYKLLSLQFLLEGLNRTEILSRLSSEPWLNRHHILTRWGWMDYQRQSISQKQKSKYPYECKLGRWDTRNTEDYEFFVLLHFLPHYYEQQKTPYLYLKRPAQRQHSPDFIISSDTQTLGLEITMAPQTETYGKSLSYQSRFRNYLKERYQESAFSIQINRISSWFDVFENKEHLADLIHLTHCLYKSQRFSEEHYQWNDLFVQIEFFEDHAQIKVNQFGGSIIDFFWFPLKVWKVAFSTSFKRDSSDSERSNEDICVESILERMNQKYRSYPEDDTLLVIWPIHEFTDLDDISLQTKLIAQKDALLFSNHFKQTWLFTGSCSLQIF